MGERYDKILKLSKEYPKTSKNPLTPVEQRDKFWENKWRLRGRNTFTTDGGNEVTKLFETMIPPTSGDRTDILTECGKYYFGKTKKEFMARMSKEDYLDKIMPRIYIQDEKERKKFEKDRKKALKEMTWTPRTNNEEIAIIIEIKAGEITLKGK